VFCEKLLGYFCCEGLQNFADGFARIGRTPDRQELSVLAVLEIAEVHGDAEI
jgi:hypothetical protein